MPPSAHPGTLSKSLQRAPTWRKVQCLLIGTLLARGRRTVTVALRHTGQGNTSSFSLYHQVFNRARWSAPGSSPEQALKGSRCLLALLVQTFDAAGGSLTFISDILRRLKPTASNMEVQRLQLPRRASWPVVSLLRPGVTPGTPEEHVPLAARLRAALRSA